MIVQLTADEAAFRDEVRVFLDQALTPALRLAGHRTSGIFTEYPANNQWHQRPGHARLERAALAGGPWGGTGWTPMPALASSPANVPPPTRRRIAPHGPVRMVAPVVIAYGTPEQQQRWLPAIRATATDYWCQGYSEPGSGSDLASLQCKRGARRGPLRASTAPRSGPPTPTTPTASSAWCAPRARRQAAAGHQLPAASTWTCPASPCGPFISVSGDHELNQVFFDDVRVPASGLIGKPDDGWTVAKYLLQHERGGAWAPYLRSRWRRLQRALDQAFDGARRGCAEHHDLRLKLADAHVRIESLQALELATLRARQRGVDDPAAPSIGKLLGTELKPAPHRTGTCTIAGPYAATLRLPAGRRRRPRAGPGRRPAVRHVAPT
jgi:alkylation response protein AidB-like acyl-CoA dehydrogenase